MPLKSLGEIHAPLGMRNVGAKYASIVLPSSIIAPIPRNATQTSCNWPVENLESVFLEIAHVVMPSFHSPFSCFLARISVTSSARISASFYPKRRGNCDDFPPRPGKKRTDFVQRPAALTTN